MLTVDAMKLSLSLDVAAESVSDVMPALVKRPASMDVCISRSFSFPDSYASIAHPLSESPSKDRVFQLRLFQPGFLGS